MASSLRILVPVKRVIDYAVSSISPRDQKLARGTLKWIFLASVMRQSTRFNADLKFIDYHRPSPASTRRKPASRPPVSSIP
jgi:hypothetical protein